MQRISKTLAGIVGGYLAAVTIHLAVGAMWGSSASWIQTTTYSAFALWIAAIIVALLLRIIYFLLALLSCFMIISGVLIWQVARDNSRYSDKQKLFHHRITKLNLSVCLSLFPAVAILFIANKMVPVDYNGRGVLVEQIFFISWLLMAAVGWKWDQYGEMTKNYFVLGGLLSLLVPVLNGIVTGDWLWHSWGILPAVAGIDILWLLTGSAAIWAASKISTDPKPKPGYGSGRCPAPGKKERKVIVR